MNDRRTNLRELLDAERRLCGTPSDRDGLVREWAHDKSECRIVFADISLAALPDTIRNEKARAGAGGYALEWKVYGHDRLFGLPEMLVANEFARGDLENVLWIQLDAVEWHRFGGLGFEMRSVRDESGLADVAAISAQIGRRDVEAETNRLNAMLRAGPDALSIHVSYVDGVPVSCGRIHYGRNGVAELAGGRTVPSYRRRGLFTAVIGSRLREAAARGCHDVFVDARPASEPILTRLGFEAVTTTQPFTYGAP